MLARSLRYKNWVLVCVFCMYIISSFFSLYWCSNFFCKVFARKLRRAIGKGEYSSAERLRENKPHYTLDHIVRERYPTFLDAVRDLSDCLSLCFLFATLPSSRRTQGVQISLCRRLTVEFMLYVISTKSLRKVFVSIKVSMWQLHVVQWFSWHLVDYGSLNNRIAFLVKN
jgi:pescadillo